jgi:hypothetical protein
MFWLGKLRIRRPTIIMLTIVGSAIGYAQVPGHRGLSGIRGLFWYNENFGHGWPLRAILRTDRYDSIQTGARPRGDIRIFRAGWITTTRYQVLYIRLAINLVAVATILVSTAATCNYWLERPRRWYQLSLRESLAITALVGMLICIYQGEYRMSSKFHQFLYVPLHELPWYITGVLLFAMGCTAFALAHRAVELAYDPFRRTV